MAVTALLETGPDFISGIFSHPDYLQVQEDLPLQESITETRLKTLLKALPAGVIVLDGA